MPEQPGAWALQVDAKHGNARHRFVHLAGNTLELYKQAKDKHSPRADVYLAAQLREASLSEVWLGTYQELPAGVSNLRASLLSLKNTMSLVRPSFREIISSPVRPRS